MSDRFYLPGPWQPVVEITGTEMHHLAHVMRHKSGDIVTIFDGQGQTATASLQQIGKRGALLQILTQQQDPEQNRPLTVLAVACPKGDRLKWMVEKVTELGLDRLIPLKTRHSVVEPGGQKWDKIEMASIAACKQCHRNRLLKIDPICTLEELPERIDFSTSRLWVGYQNGESVSEVSFQVEPPYTQNVAMIGPEGGWSEEEKELLRGWNSRFLNVAPHVLRIETAAVAFTTHFVAS